MCTAQVRTSAQNIANNPGAKTGNKFALGLNPKTTMPEPITAPTNFPVLALQAVTPPAATSRYRLHP